MRRVGLAGSRFCAPGVGRDIDKGMVWAPRGVLRASRAVRVALAVLVGCPLAASGLDTSIPAVRADKVHALGYRGLFADVAVIDSGVGVLYAGNNHPDLASGPSEVTQQNATPQGTAQDETTSTGGHGTHVAGIVASKDGTYRGVAPDADLLGSRVFSGRDAYWSDVVAGFEWARGAGADVANASIWDSSVTNSNGTDASGGYQKIQIYLDYLVDNPRRAGANDTMAEPLTVTLISGNGSERAPELGNPRIDLSSPSSVPGAAFNGITVGATGWQATDGAMPDYDRAAQWSGRRGTVAKIGDPVVDGGEQRSKPDIVAPGVWINSTNNDWGPVADNLPPLLNTDTLAEGNNDGNPAAEAFTDTNGDGRHDPGEPFTDRGNGRWDPAESLRGGSVNDMNGNDRWDGAEAFTDANGNGSWDPGEAFTDVGNGQWDAADDDGYDFVRMSGTSMAAPHVAGAAALLYDVGSQKSLTEAGTPNDAELDHKVIKAVLLNGTDKVGKDPGAAGVARDRDGSVWTHSSLQPLDDGLGAGQLDVYNAYRNYIASDRKGEENPSDVSSRTVARIGWDIHTLTQGGSTSHYYTLEDPLDVDSWLTATLVWDMHVTWTDKGNGVVDYDDEFVYQTLDDLDLYLYLGSWDDLVRQVDWSTSYIDNVEQLHWRILESGYYTLRVDLASGDGETYALAWWATPEPASLLLIGTGTLVMAGVRRRRRADGD